MQRIFCFIFCFLALACQNKAAPEDPDDKETPIEVPLTCPQAPDDLVSYLSGEAQDKRVTPLGPGLILNGGGQGADDESFVWWRPYLQGGDVVILRTSGSDGYNDYLFNDIGGIDSVETLLVTDTTLANDDYVACRILQAEGIFIAGGDQSTYLNHWRETKLSEHLGMAWQRGAMLGGNSAGLAVLGEFVFAAYQGSAYSEDVVLDPYDATVSLENALVPIPFLQGLITDTHFVERDRMGRLAVFMARLLKDGWGSSIRGLGIDEDTAFVVAANGMGTLMGNGTAYLLESTRQPSLCLAGQSLTFEDLKLYRFSEGDQLDFSDFSATVTSSALDIIGGVLEPSDPY
ncbi:MAG: cyanophycinase [Myxococcota bacterium]|jgi:cyanophycinase|nr:cyanophycinase [Myxococcota bacterium]